MSKQASPTYYEVVRDILALKMSASTKIVLLYIYDRQGGNKYAWPSLTTICRDCNLSKGTVVNALHMLQKSNLLKVKHPANPSKKEGESNRYTVLLTGLKIEPVQKLDRSKNCTPTGLKIEPQPVQKLDPNDSYNDSVNDSSKKRGRSRFTPPTLKQIEDYVKEKNLNVNCRKFLAYYTESKWKDRNGKPVRNWKLKLVGVWDNGQGNETNQSGSRQNRQRPQKNRSFAGLQSNVGESVEITT